MRRVLTTAVLSLTLLGAAACAADPAETTATPSSSAAPAASSAAPAAPTGTQSKEATCLAFNMMGISEESLGVLAATTKIIGAAIDDEEKAKTHVPALVTAIEAYRAQLAKLSADTADAEVKAALEADIATVAGAAQALTAANGDFDKVIAVLEGTALDIHENKTSKLCAP
ncbi:hypothetical protein [Catellatospora coxensis]|uniref:Uncharacterized protein n=1 Tax=Catellatospora coxensis TaxID=310354 RepID=A0A8J3P787_9ACTN|nr:hypothetical protein [Catellatospora coxensis]GIG06168.1 hypothetical protein Cco03nite_28680 [Catellatospora coxensis]